MSTIVKIRGSVINNAFYFKLRVNGRLVKDIVLDTGAFELTFNGGIAKSLRLPKLRTIRISGVGGTVRAYQSRCNIQLGRKTYFNVPCVIDPALPESALFGLRFFVDNQLALHLYPKSQIFAISSS